MSKNLSAGKAREVQSPRETLGGRLRQLRREQGLTLKQLAERIGKSESYLSRVEHNRIDLTLSTLKDIASGLGRPIIHLLDSGLPGTDGVVKRGTYRRLVVSSVLEYEILSSSNQEMSLFRMILKEGGDSGDRPYRHQGIESGIMLKGRVQITVGDSVYVLEAGDSLTYHSQKLHSFKNIGKGDAVAIWAVAPATF